MKKLLLLCLTALPLVIPSCSRFSEDPVSTAGDGNKPVTIAIAIPPEADTLVASAVVKVSADDMTPIKTPMNVDGSYIFGTVEKVPFGDARFFEVYVFDMNGTTTFYGSKYADVNPGMPSVSIILRKVKDGTVFVEGKFEDSTMYQEFPIEHSISVTDRFPDLEQVYVFMSAFATLPADWSGPTENPFEYSWLAYERDSRMVIDTMHMEWSTDPMYTMLTLPWNGVVRVEVAARYTEQPDIITYDTIDIVIEDGWVSEEGAAPEFKTDSLWIELSPGDSADIPLYSKMDTVMVTATGEWYMNSSICCTPDGDCSVSKTKFIEPAFCGGTLLAKNGGTVSEIGSSGYLVQPSEDFKVTLFGNHLKNNRSNESGKITLTVLHMHP